MTAKEALDKARILLKTYFADTPPAETIAGKLKDGTEVQYTALEVGASLFIIDADGNPTPAPAAEYEMEDGSIVVVTDPGVISEIKPAPAAEGPKAEEMAADPAPAAADQGKGIDWSEEIKSIQQSLAWMAQRIASLSTAMQMFRQATGESFASMVDAVEASASEGKEDPIKKPRQTVFGSNKDVKQTALEKMQKGVQAFNERLSKQNTAS
ncbi:hypothetical protein FHW36_10675 [Chitinophaga polysaccharea]|uniref:Uncharacterized protein n=1 Tax=Chitinophaga polysaccharea TaxID=1293035 RepID=A0A561PL73_9BACT|nr:hypothetical protein [Chitinophaga polysaccharea]TWF38852.1 hypothetical protein FHW36_10675 [Chitinophaga polysaccharea]